MVNLNGLPLEVLTQIASYCSATTLLSFSATNIHCYNAAQMPLSKLRARFETLHNLPQMCEIAREPALGSFVRTINLNDSSFSMCPPGPTWIKNVKKCFRRLQRAGLATRPIVLSADPVPGTPHDERLYIESGA